MRSLIFFIARSLVSLSLWGGGLSLNLITYLRVRLVWELFLVMGVAAWA